jgi:hypothetical protein
MQDPNTGLLEPIPKDDPKNIKPGWQPFNVGEEVNFRGWWWRIEAFTADGGMTVKAVRKSKKSGARSRPSKPSARKKNRGKR